MKALGLVMIVSVLVATSCVPEDQDLVGARCDPSTPSACGPTLRCSPSYYRCEAADAGVGGQGRALRPKRPAATGSQLGRSRHASFSLSHPSLEGVTP